MKYQLVPMDRSHLPAAVRLEQQVFSHPWSAQLLEDELYNPHVSLVAAQGEQGEFLGYGMVSAVLDEGCLEKIVVDPQYRRQGVAEGILKAFLRFGWAHLAFLTLEVRESNAPAIALYQKLGFQEVGRRKRYYTDPVEDAVLLTADFAASREKEGQP